MKDKIYPAFYRSTDGYDYLYLDAANYYGFSSAEWSKADGIDTIDHKDDENITREYLANTYGEVVSPDHAEFIIELAELHGLKLAFTSPMKTINAFAFKGGNLYLYGLGLDELTQLPTRKITIPLPPKTEPLKNAGDNLILGCEDSKCDEWPCVGDEVCWSNGKRKGELKSICDGWAWIKDDSGEFISLMAKFIKKPKTPEEELRDEIGVYLCEKYNFITGAESLEITETLLMKYNITKKPQ